MASSININQNNNDITLQDNNRSISITDNNSGTTINVTQPVTNVVTVATPGPQGPIGPIPTSGSFTGSFSGSFIGNLTGTSSYATSASYALTASYALNGGSGGGGNFIATGSISASVSLGTGSFTITSGSSTFMFVSSSGNVGIGTSTPPKQLSVISTTVSGGLYIEQSNVSTAIPFEIKTLANNARTYVDYGGTWTYGNGIQMQGYSIGLASNVNIQGTSNLLKLYGGAGIDLSTISVTNAVRLFQNGNVGVGTTTDAGYKLDVNGTARVKGTGTTIGTTSFTVQDSTSSDLFRVYDSGLVLIKAGVISLNGGNGSISGGFIASTGQMGAGTTSVVASAQLQIDSTTKGFLPPRMTLAQRVAISSPASGLIVYETGSATTEGLWLNETTGWQQLLTNSGSQSISGSLNVTSFTASNAIISGNVTVLGTASINTLVVNQTQFTSGSNQLGDAADDFQTLYGTVRIPTGSLTVTGSARITGSLNVVGQVSSNDTFVSTAVYPNPIGFATSGSLTGPVGFHTNIWRGTYTGNTFSYVANAHTSSVTNNALAITRPTNSSFAQFTLYVKADTTSVMDMGGGAPILDIANNGVPYSRFDGTNFSVGTTSSLARLHVRGTGTTSGTTSLLVQNSAGTQTGKIDDQGNTTWGSNTSSGTHTFQGYNVAMITLSDTLNGYSTTLYKNASSGYLIENSSTNKLSYGYSGNYWMSWHGSLKAIAISSTASEPTPATTAILDLQSTTKGFLPTRTNTTSSISSPAQGLMTYLTGSTNEGLYYYNSGSTPGWRQVADTTFVSASLSGSAGYLPVFTGANSVSSSVIFQSGSNIGIGTSTPNYNLHNTGTTALSQVFGTTSSLYVFNGRTGHDSTLKLENQSGDLLYFGGSGLLVTGNTTIGNGTSTLSARLGVKGSGTTSATTSFLVQNSAGTTNFTIRDDGSTSLNAFRGGQLSIGAGDGFGANQMRIYFEGISTGYTYIDGYSDGTNKGNNVPIVFGARLNNVGSSLSGASTIENGTPVIFGFNTWNLSSIVTMNSTTRGFLPPRTNLTSNISSPAQGLMTYVTASATEGLYYYNSGSAVGWHKVLTNSGSQEISGSLTVTGSINVTGSTSLVGSSTATAGTYTFTAASAGDGGIRIDNSINGYTSLNWISNAVGLGLMAGGGIFARVSNNAGFHIGQSANSTYVATLAVTGHTSTTGTTFLARNSAGTNILKVIDNGRVGINNANPSSSLDVAGTTRISGSFNTAISGAILTVQGSGSAQPIFTVQGSQGELFSITDSLSGSLFSVNDISGLPILEVFSDNTTLIGNYQDPMLITTAKVVQTNSGSFTLYSLPTASYDTAFFEYSIRSGSNARAGTIMAIQSGSAVNFTETTTTDFGSTSAVSFTVIVTGSNMALTGSSTSGAWTIKTIVRGI